MKFKVSHDIFNLLPEACFGVVTARGIDNKAAYPVIADMLREGIAKAQERFHDVKVKEDAAILPYRNAFTKMSINPNKFMSSIEAMFTRISKGHSLPQINPIVDLGNALSLRYVLPMGAHDIDLMDGDIEVRLSVAGDTFIPFGETETEQMPDGEPVYVVDSHIRTRRWIWRQSEIGKIGPDSSNIFFPIDGFRDVNRDTIISARDALAAVCRDVFGCSAVSTGFVDSDNPEMEL